MATPLTPEEYTKLLERHCQQLIEDLMHMDAENYALREMVEELRKALQRRDHSDD